MALWQKLWLLFSAIWISVAALNVGAILALSEEPQKAWLPAAAGVAVPALAYGLAWLWQRWRRGKRGD